MAQLSKSFLDGCQGDFIEASLIEAYHLSKIIDFIDDCIFEKIIILAFRKCIVFIVYLLKYTIYEDLHHTVHLELVR